MGKFKVGDRVITRKFSHAIHGCSFWDAMEELDGKIGKIDVIYSGSPLGMEYYIHEYWWPESSLELFDPSADVTIQTSAKGISVVISPDRVAIMEGDCMVVDFTQQEVTEIFTAMKAFK